MRQVNGKAKISTPAPTAPTFFNQLWHYQTHLIGENAHKMSTAAVLGWITTFHDRFLPPSKHTPSTEPRPI